MLTYFASEQVKECIESKNRLEVIKYLIKQKGCDKNVQDNNGETPLHLASRGDASSLYYKGTDIDLIEYLIKQGCDKNVKDNNGRTPIDLVKIRLDKIDHKSPYDLQLIKYLENL